MEKAIVCFRDGYRMIACSLDITMLARACRSGLSDPRKKNSARLGIELRSLAAIPVRE